MNRDIEFTLRLKDSLEEFYQIVIKSRNEQLFSEAVKLDGSYYESELNAILDTRNWTDKITDEFVVALQSVLVLEKIENILND